jgi:hypothetical protein
MSRTTKISPVFVGFFILGTVCLSTHVAQVECEACVTLHGTTTCRKGYRRDPRGRDSGRGDVGVLEHGGGDD